MATAAPTSSASLLTRAIIAAMAGLAAGAAVRYGLIEPASLGWACQVADPPFWCPPRRILIMALQWGALGGVALAVALLALLGAGRRTALIAAGLGAAALFLYGAGAGSVAVLLSLLRALRLPAAALPLPSSAPPADQRAR
jgi:hypothetical protein